MKVWCVEGDGDYCSAMAIIAAPSGARASELAKGCNTYPWKITWDEPTIMLGLEWDGDEMTLALHSHGE